MRWISFFAFLPMEKPVHYKTISSLISVSWGNTRKVFLFFFLLRKVFLYLYQYLYLCYAVLSCSIMSDSLRPHEPYPPGSSVDGDSPGKNTGVGCHALLQGIFPTQGLNLGLLHYKRILYHLSHGENPRILE